MRVVIILACLLMLATSAYADKVPGDINNNAPLNSARQGGETSADAVAINLLPASLTGTTMGYVHDHDIDCALEYGIGSSPDVVYSLVPCMDGNLSFTNCLDITDYDSKLGIFDANMNLVACSDDFCSTAAYPYPYVAEISDANMGSVPVIGGELYYVVVSGYGSSSSGNYGLDITGMDCTTPVQVLDWSSVKANY